MNGVNLPNPSHGSSVRPRTTPAFLAAPAPTAAFKSVRKPAAYHQKAWTKAAPMTSRLGMLRVRALQMPGAQGSSTQQNIKRRSSPPQEPSGPYVDQLLSALDRSAAHLKAIESDASSLHEERSREEANLDELREEARLAEVHMEKELKLQEGYLIEAMDALTAKQRLVAGLEELVGDTRAKLEALRAASGESTGGAGSQESLAEAFRAKHLSAEDIPVTPDEAMEWMQVWADAQAVASGGAAGGALPNVLEAQRWISAWREAQGNKGEDVLPNALEAQRWISAWREVQGTDEILPNVLEAQMWISAWREVQGTEDDSLPNVLEAQRWIAAWREVQGKDDQDVLPNALEAQRWIASWREVQGNKDEDVLPNVLEAQMWISAWREVQGNKDEVLPNALEAQRWIAAWREVHEKDDEAFPNVLEAQRWISAWREVQGKDDEILPNVVGAQKWIAAWREVQGTDEILPNVVEAQRWIAAWREARAVAEKEEWKAKLASWRKSHSSGKEEEEAQPVQPLKAEVAAEKTEADEGCSVTEVGDDGAASVVDLRCSSQPDTVQGLSSLIAAASARAVAERGAFCIALSGSELQYAAVLMAGIPADEISRWTIVWAREANAPASSATRSSAAASAAFLGSPRWYGAQALPLQHQPEHGPEEAARSYEALLQTLPEELLPEAPHSSTSSRRLPRLDLVLACCNGEVGGLEDAFPSSSSSRWVLPDPSQGQSGAGGICLSFEAVQAAAQVIIHH